jgi:hypothetical protein
MCGSGSLSESSFSATLGAALQTTITIGVATTVMLLIADLATVAEVPQYRQLGLFTAYFMALLAFSTLLFEMFFGGGYTLLDRGLHRLVLYQYVAPILAAWTAYVATLWCHPSR